MVSAAATEVCCPSKKAATETKWMSSSLFLENIEKPSRDLWLVNDLFIQL